MKAYHHYCRQCRKYWPCKHPDPEKQKATGPCGHELLLGHGSTFEDLKTQIHLGKSEIGEGEVVYKSM